MSEITHGSESVMSVCADGSVREALFITALSSSTTALQAAVNNELHHSNSAWSHVEELITSHVL